MEDRQALDDWPTSVGTPNTDQASPTCKTGMGKITDRHVLTQIVQARPPHHGGQEGVYDWQACVDTPSTGQDTPA